MKIRIGVGLGALALDEFAPTVQCMERCGFDSLWLSEVLTTGVIDPLTGLAHAAGLTKTPTGACLGVEDADAGIEAIKNAGMQALGIGPKDRFHRADKVLPTLANASLQDILNN